LTLAAQSARVSFVTEKQTINMTKKIAQELAKKDGVEFYGGYFPSVGWSTYAVRASQEDFQAALAFLPRTDDNLVEKFDSDSLGTGLIFY